MKTKLITVTAILLILALSTTGCNKRSECDCQELIKNAMVGNCTEYSFLETIEMHTPFLIKGVASDAIEYGRRIRLIEDLIGNFPKDVGNSFIAWGAGGFIYISACSKVDHLTIWENGDTLLMLLFPHFEDETERARKYLEDIGRPECIPVLLIEKPGDYITLPGRYSVIKLSGDSVIGRFICPDVEQLKYLPEYNSYMQILSRKYFFERLQEILNSKPPNN